MNFPQKIVYCNPLKKCVPIYCCIYLDLLKMRGKSSKHTSRGQEFMLLGADINLSATVWSAADRIRKLSLRGQCGMVRFHPVLDFGRRNPTARKNKK